jgi:hypothetical protein
MAACPATPTAAQKDAEAQDTDDSVASVSIWSGALHVLPLYVRASPELLTAIQNEDEGQETDTS